MVKSLTLILEKILPQSWFGNLYLYRHIYKLITREEAYLVNTGYVNSVRKFKPVDKDDEPIPWMNYSFIDFLEPRLNKNLKVYEYGSGYSTLYLADRVKSVISIEYDKTWFEKVKQDLNQKQNCTLLYYPSPEKYKTAIKDFEGQLFDIIIIDGRDRVECAYQTFSYLSENGVLILDDSWRKEYGVIFDFLKDKGFRDLSITGLKAGGLKIEETTIFYRSGNVLNI